MFYVSLRAMFYMIRLTSDIFRGKAFFLLNLSTCQKQTNKHLYISYILLSETYKAGTYITQHNLGSQVKTW